MKYQNGRYVFPEQNPRGKQSDKGFANSITLALARQNLTRAEEVIAQNPIEGFVLNNGNVIKLNNMEEKDEFIKDFIKVGKLREMLSILDDDDFITVSTFIAKKGYHKIGCLEDCTSVGFWELRCE